MSIWIQHQGFASETAGSTHTAGVYKVPYFGKYSVMQSDRNSLCGDIVLDSVNMASRNEDNILNKLFFLGGGIIDLKKNKFSGCEINWF